jgi:hypothetical protein
VLGHGSRDRYCRLANLSGYSGFGVRRLGISSQPSEAKNLVGPGSGNLSLIAVADSQASRMATFHAYGRKRGRLKKVRVILSETKNLRGSEILRFAQDDVLRRSPERSVSLAPTHREGGIVLSIRRLFIFRWPGGLVYWVIVAATA